jgi:hypothetical protein
MSLTTQTWTDEERKAIEQAFLRKQLVECPRCQDRLAVNPFICETGCTVIQAACYHCRVEGSWGRDPQSFERWTPEQREAHRYGKEDCSSCGSKVDLFVNGPVRVAKCMGCGN